MKKRSKKYEQVLQKINAVKEMSLSDAIDVLKNTSLTKFDPTVDVAVRLSVDPRKADQLVRGTAILPAGTGKNVSILVLCKEHKQQEAKDEGADMVGFEEYIEKIKGGWTDVDVIVATPDVMVEVGKVGKVLGPKKLMPNPKSGTVTNDIKKVVKELKAGKIEFRVDKSGVVHAGVAKLSFSKEKIEQNIKTLFSAIIKARPSSAKGQYVKSIYLSSTMSPSIKLRKDQIEV